MKYVGGKHGIGKLIANFMENKCPPDGVNGYIEPFCGSLDVVLNIMALFQAGFGFTLNDIQTPLMNFQQCSHYH